MYAVVKAGGSQHKVAVGDTFTINRLAGAAGATIGLHRISLTQLAARLAAPHDALPTGPVETVQGERPRSTPPVRAHAKRLGVDLERAERGAGGDLSFSSLVMAESRRSMVGISAWFSQQAMARE